MADDTGKLDFVLKLIYLFIYNNGEKQMIFCQF